MEDIASELVEYALWAYRAKVPIPLLIVPAIPIVRKIVKNKRVRKAASRAWSWVKGLW